MDESSGLGFWKSLTLEQLLVVINSPHAYKPVDRAFAAQEYSSRILQDEYCNSSKDSNLSA
jgi:hypothetical protein